MKTNFNAYTRDTIEMLEGMVEDPPSELELLIDSVYTAWQNDGKVVSCGNGGSASDSEHFVTELVARFSEDPIHKPALSLTACSSTLTAISNDWSYTEVFSRQVRAQVRPEDVLLGISTSGQSQNVIRALETAQAIGASCFGLTGNTPRAMEELDCTIISVPSDVTAHVQEAHTVCLHYVCQQLDRRLRE